MNYSPRPIRKRLLLALAVLPFVGVVAAFGIAPDTVTDTLPRETKVESVALPEIKTADAGTFDFWREERVARGDSLANVLSRMGVDSTESREFLGAAREAKPLATLVPGRTALARVTASGQVLLFRYLAPDDTLVTINRVNGTFKVEQKKAILESRMIMRSGSIQASLFAATDAADVPDRIASEMAEVFSGDIDFHRSLRRGDHFSVIYEGFFLDGQLIRSGRLVAAEFVNQGKSFRALYFKDAQGRDGYYSPDGQSMKRAFLKSPMPFTRISSGFSNARYHPVLKEWRAHKGIDYAAPAGTPIRAIADATVNFAGSQGGYGNLILLNHRGNYSTAYGHLSRFAKGVRRGTAVKQGQVIGYVGATGLATGPHLHFEFRVAGVQQNPLALKLPTTYPLDTHSKAVFLAKSQLLNERLELLRSTNLASLN
ncbi:MAG TPA: peptidoglycan DD-metalloendopeptidase family protein [Thiobacillaceae bacterium]|nr:peptidoglycan DD-metalloendopeptidase family protein [Thiobacillaceae bacterium]HNF88171.1 peptidoglycan DD-metalloendopeptidase family protein [Thiobacillaceae bacterium]HNH88420.1 peptidoglycan DD-metalloendopeptidase family protein [Thiobacillaceae bacterium]HNI06867.1 peptidoglycan DD-metalloendopeptidase family protein [Thiobacillaceae bacterium]